jgi:hypothetical protein
VYIRREYKEAKRHSTMDVDPDISQTNADITAHFNHALESTKDRVRELKLELCKKFDQERAELNAIVEKLTTERDEGEFNAPLRNPCDPRKYVSLDSFISISSLQS